MVRIKVGINGFGRIGRLVARVMIDEPGLFEVVAVHDLESAAQLAHLFKHDTVHGALSDYEVRVEGNEIVVLDELGLSEQRLAVLGGKVGPAQIDWGQEIDVVVEATGIYSAKADPATGKDGFDGHLGRNGCRRVLLTVPPKGEIDATIVVGVNDNTLKPEHLCVSNASCTTNCLAPLAKVLNDNFGIVRGFMNTVHAITNDQVVADQIHKDLRRARAAGSNIIPTSTGAAKAIGVVLPELDGKLDGFATRVPVIDGSMVHLIVETEKEASKEAVNAAMAEEANSGPLASVLEYSDEPLVSSDIIGNPHSCIFDSQLTAVKGGHLVSVVAWYDNEWGYSNRVADLIELMFK